MNQTGTWSAVPPRAVVRKAEPGRARRAESWLVVGVLIALQSATRAGPRFRAWRPRRVDLPRVARATYALPGECTRDRPRDVPPGRGVAGRPASPPRDRAARHARPPAPGAV